MRKLSKAGYLILLVLLCCKTAYTPPAITAKSNFLVIEGVIYSGADSTIFQLSRTVNISSNNVVNPEPGAVVTVEGNDNSTYPLTEIRSGYYATVGLNLDNTKQYRLRVLTSDNKQYLSDFVAVQPTPPIDSVGFTISNNGLQLYVNAHDATNRVKYFRYSYEEAWKFHAEYFSTFISNGSAIVARTLDQYTYYCYAHDVSSDIVLGSTAQLKQDVLYQLPITLIDSTSEKIEIEYSILLHQYALTSDAYNFWVNLKKNSEQLGGIFDPQPSLNMSNIHCITNPSTPVIGYISACSASSKRIFISDNQLPDDWLPTYPYACSIISQKTAAFNLIPLPNFEIPMSIGGATYAYYTCTDCTIRGTLAPPPFWPQ